MQRESVKAKAALKKSTRARTSHADSVRKSKQSALSKRRRLPSHELDDVDDLEFQSLLLALASDDEGRVVEALHGLKAALSVFNAERMDKVAESGVIPILLQLLERPSSSTVELVQVLWCLTSITSGLYEHTKCVLPAVPILLTFLENHELAEHAAWTLGNIAADCEEFRLYLIRHGAIPPLVRHLAHHAHPGADEMTTVCLWTLANMARGVQTPAQAFLDHGVGPRLLEILTSAAAPAVVQEALWLVSFLSAKEDKALAWLLDHGLVPALERHFEAKDEALLTPLLRVCGNVASVSGHHKDEVAWQVAYIQALAAEPRFLYMLKRVLHPTTPEASQVVAEAAWVVSNFAARDQPTVQLLVQYELLPPLARAFLDGPYDVRKEASFALANIGRTSKDLLTLVLTYDGLLDGFVSLLAVADVSVVSNALYFLHHVMSTLPATVYTIEGLGAIDAFENIQDHDAGDNGRLATLIMDQFYGDDYDPLVSPTSASPPVAFDAPPPAGGRGAHMTKPAWAT